MKYDKNMYAFNSRIRFSEVDYERKIYLFEILNYLQDCATFQTEDVSASLQYMYENNMAWVVSAWHIKINRYPSLGERVTIGTLPYKLKGIFGHRNFIKNEKNTRDFSHEMKFHTIVSI